MRWVAAGPFRRSPCAGGTAGAAPSNCHPEPGDLIDIDHGVYKHWAVYVGDGYVIHVTDDGASSLSSGSSSVFSSRAKVKKQLLKEVVGNDEWQVNKYDRSRTPLPVEKIL